MPEFVECSADVTLVALELAIISKGKGAFVNDPCIRQCSDPSSQTHRCTILLHRVRVRVNLRVRVRVKVRVRVRFMVRVGLRDG